MFFKNSVLRCFAVFCGVLRCFVCVFLAFFIKQFQNSTKQTNNYTKRTKRTKYALCNTAHHGAVHLSLTQKMSTKINRKTRPKHCKTSTKHRKTLFFKKHLQNTTKHPQNTAKHHKTHLLTKQTELANKPLRSLTPATRRELLLLLIYMLRSYKRSPAQPPAKACAGTPLAAGACYVPAAPTLTRRRQAANHDFFLNPTNSLPLCPYPYPVQQKPRKTRGKSR